MAGFEWLPQPKVRAAQVIYLVLGSFGNDTPAAMLVHEMHSGWKSVPGSILTFTVPAARSEEFARFMAASGVNPGAFTMVDRDQKASDHTPLQPGSRRTPLMASVNKVILVGNLGKDPEVRYTPSGSAICNITLATSRQWKSKDTGERQEETEWHRVALFDRLAEIAGEYLKKGRPVYVEGRLKTRKYTDKDNVEKYTTEIVATEMQLLGGREGGDETSAARQQSVPATRGAAPAVKPSVKQPAVSAPYEDDDIPF